MPDQEPLVVVKIKVTNTLNARVSKTYSTTNTLNGRLGTKGASDIEAGLHGASHIKRIGPRVSCSGQTRRNLLTKVV